MRTLSAEEKSLRDRAGAWVGTLAYHCAQGLGDEDALAKRLESLLDPVLQPEYLEPLVKEALSRIRSEQFMSNLKEKLLGRRGSRSFEEHLSLAEEVLELSTQTGVDGKTLTLGELVTAWCELTKQNPDEFRDRIHPKLNRLLKEWQASTGSRGLEDRECFLHPREASRFSSGLCRTLLQETPEANLSDALANGLLAFQKGRPTSRIHAKRDLTRQVCHVIARQARRSIDTVLGTNPKAAAALADPEVAALVEWEEQKQGWGGSASKATRLLKKSLAPEFQEYDDQPSEADILSSLKSVGRRSLLNNLVDAAHGRLKPRFIATVCRYLQDSYTRVASHWQFDASPLADTSIAGIRQWLFRR